MDLMPEFIEKNITVAKRAASLSRFGNTLDAGNIHKATKSRQKHMSDEDAMHEMETIVDFIKKNIKALCPHLTNAKVSIMACSSVRVVSAFQATLSKLMIKHSFQKASQWFPLSLQKKLSLFPLPIIREDVERMEAAFPTAVEIMRATGLLTEAQMDELDVPESDNGDKRALPKDQRVLHHQRSVILTHELVASRYAKYKAKKEELAVKQKKPKSSKQEKALAKHVVIAEKEARAAAKVLERKRKADLIAVAPKRKRRGHSAKEVEIEEEIVIL